ncbi:nucleotidyl transferase AbiEii/AbiGii toxin family protein [Mycetocola spongiae]|uniref:nucleotidyl transferase AbiEii/AbiGii toxin family protein n=1 Tax=Mycetocola spongiae TaxID=2859226 RepID=UPI001CF4C873|nr:nucleotidyl transferase AbiEii/AbiGii toxin family protein [Mycetocola spongiae]UCR90500.1 nucleotidyl transferase AbiEii/AbiGii toxin family protein [Mycetocola spongiae]
MTTRGESERTWEEFAAFTVNVLAPEWTLFEKLAAVHDAASRADRDALLKHGRHFYDIHCLLKDKQLTDALEALGREGIKALVDDIDSQSAAADFSYTPRPIEGYAHSPAFDREHTTRDTIETGYEAAQALIYGELVPIDVVINTVNHRRELL